MNKKHFILATILLFLCLGFFAPIGCKAPITGTVTDAATGNPIAGAWVTIEGVEQAVTTDTDGTYAFNSILYGSYTITVSSTGFENNTSDPAYSI